MAESPNILSDPDVLRDRILQGSWAAAAKKSGLSASLVFKFLFWVHQAFFGLPSIGIGLDLIFKGQTDGILAAIGLLLAWIAGTLLWGLAAIIHRKQI